MDDFYFKGLIIKGDIYMEKGRLYHHTPGGGTFFIFDEEDRFIRLKREMEIDKILDQ
tara:strand:- start:23205 stop:23375 length:171 start_codon:yes stop_codon:yes gene_type:complete